MKTGFQWTPRIYRGEKPMTLAEFKKRMAVGTMIRKVSGPPFKAGVRYDQLRVIVVSNTIEVGTEGDGVPAGKGPSMMKWPKAPLKSATQDPTGNWLEETGRGFIIRSKESKRLDMEWEWVSEDDPSPKDRACNFILNTFEHCLDEIEAVLTLGDILGNHEAADTVVKAYRNLNVTVQHALEKPEVCDRSLRLWLDTCWDWSYVPQTIDV